MNPFELPGPQFLAFYAVLGAGVLFCGVLSEATCGRRRSRSACRRRDPYLIAYLRGGATEAVRLGVTVLVDRLLLELEGDRVVRRERVSPTHGSNDLERAILEQCETATRPRRPRRESAPAGNRQAIV